MWFGLVRQLTSTTRWISQISLLSNFVLLTPPFVKKQILINLRTGKFQKIEISSYFDWATIYEIFIRRWYSIDSFAANELVESYLSKQKEKGNSPLILDAGSNIGVSAIFFALRYPVAKVVAIEPSGDNYRKLLVNTAKFPNIATIRAAISVDNNPLEIRDPGVGNNSYRTFGTDPVIETVDSRTVPEIIAENVNFTPFLAKFDIEGFEEMIFSKNTDWIDDFKVLVIETHDWMFPGQAKSANFIAALSGKKRDLVFKGENIFSIRLD